VCFIPVLNGKAADDGAGLAIVNMKAAMIAGAVRGSVAAAVNDSAGCAVLRGDGEAFAVEINVPIA